MKPDILWTGEMSFLKKAILNANGIISYISGNMNDTKAMKNSIMLSYDGDQNSVVRKYDSCGSEHYGRIADELLGPIDLSGKEVLETGCGTGIATMKILDRGPKMVLATDISGYMLKELEKKARSAGYADSILKVGIADVEELPYGSESFDVVVSNMVLGMVPDQRKMVEEMARVTRPGGGLAISTHGPTHYAEIAEAVMSGVPKTYLIGRRFLYWPRGPKYMEDLFNSQGFDKVRIERSIWRDIYENSDRLYDFISSSTGNFYASFFDEKTMRSVQGHIRRYLKDRKMNRLTLDVVYSYGKKGLR